MAQLKPLAKQGPRLYRGYYPSVSEVLKVAEKNYMDRWRNQVGRQEADRLLRNATTLGTKVHAAAQQVAHGGPVEAGMEPYAAAVGDFLERHVREVLHTELELVSPRLEFGGTLDLYCKLKSGAFAVVDYKTTAQLTREHGLQLAAYALLCREQGLAVNRRIAVRLKKDKPGEHYVRMYHDHQADVEAFLALKKFWWWRHRGAMTKKAAKKSA